MTLRSTTASFVCVWAGGPALAREKRARARRDRERDREREVKAAHTLLTACAFARNEQQQPFSLARAARGTEVDAVAAAAAARPPSLGRVRRRRRERVAHLPPSHNYCTHIPFFERCLRAASARYSATHTHNNTTPQTLIWGRLDEEFFCFFVLARGFRQGAWYVAAAPTTPRTLSPSCQISVFLRARERASERAREIIFQQQEL